MEFCYDKIGYYKGKVEKSELYDGEKDCFLCVCVD